MQVEQWSQIRQEVSRLGAAHQALVNALLSAEPFIRGSVGRRFSVCGKPGCRCVAGAKHGPFWYLSRSEGGRNRTKYLSEEKAQTVATYVEAYRRWRQLRQRVRTVRQELDLALERWGAVLAEAGEGGAKTWRTASGGPMRIKPGTPS